MKGSSIKGGRNLKGYKVRGIFQKQKKQRKKKKARRGYEDLGREKTS